MMVKIDTREKFHVITFDVNILAANMTDKMDYCLLPLLNHNVKNVIINIKDIKNIDNAAASRFIHLQHIFYEQNASFVVCELQPDVKVALDTAGLLESLNVTPTESEASDIILMEELEREMFG